MNGVLCYYSFNYTLEGVESRRIDLKLVLLLFARKLCAREHRYYASRKIPKITLIGSGKSKLRLIILPLLSNDYEGSIMRRRLYAIELSRIIGITG